MSPQTSNEPSLEEILASIRRIISEDGPTTTEAALSVPGAWPMAAEADEADEDVLVLTERVPMNGQTFFHAEAATQVAAEVATEAHAEPAADLAPAIVESWDETDAAPTAAEPVPGAEAAPPMEAPVMATSQDEFVVAEETEVETVAAFDKLDAAAQASETPSTSLLMPAPGRTLEDVIRELMQPMLKAWLDENLPAIVQARVDEEIERISKRRVR